MSRFEADRIMLGLRIDALSALIREHEERFADCITRALKGEKARRELRGEMDASIKSAYAKEIADADAAAEETDRVLTVLMDLREEARSALAVVEHVIAASNRAKVTG